MVKGACGQLGHNAQQATLVQKPKAESFAQAAWPEAGIRLGRKSATTRLIGGAMSRTWLSLRP